MNNGKYHTAQYKQKQSARYDVKYGANKTHTKTCIKCNEQFVFYGREFTKKYKDAKHCSRSCANSAGGTARRDKMIQNGTATYRTICFTHNDKKCIVCGEDKIVEVHHNDGNHYNNNVNNLIPLCPTHHQYVHSRYKVLVQPIIDAWIQRSN